MCVYLTRQVLENLGGLQGWAVVGTFYYAFQSRQLVVEFYRKVQRIFVGAIFGLVERFLHRRQIFRERLGGIHHLLIFHAFGVFVELFADVANADHCIVRLGELVVNLLRDFELPRVFFGSGGEARVLLHLHGLRFGFSIRGQSHFIISGNDHWTVNVAGPHDETRKRGGVRIVQIPDEAVETSLGRYAIGVRTAGRKIIVLIAFGYRGFLGGRFTRELVNQVAGIIQEFERDFVLRFFFERIIDHHSGCRILALRSTGRQAESATQSAIGILGLEQLHIFGGQAGRELVEQRKIVEDPERAALRGHHQLVLALLKSQIRDGNHGQVELEGLPVVASVE